MKILIVGHGKSGTTALHYAVKSALKIENEVFEPQNLGFEDGYIDLIVKFIHPGRDLAHYNAYDRRIVVVRNGLDALISYLMYLPYGKLFEEELARAYIPAVREIREGRSDLMRLVELYRQLAGLDLVEMLQAFHVEIMRSIAAMPAPFLVFKYEDFVAGRLESLENFLNVPIKVVSVRQNYGRVIRTKGQGSWKAWLSERDYAVLEASFHDFHAAMGYAFDASQLRSARARPEDGELYVFRVVNEARRERGLAELAM